MMPPLNRWDSMRYASGLAIIVGLLAAAAAAQWSDWGLRAVGLSGVAAGCAAFALTGFLTRRLPPDIRFRRLNPAERQDAAGPPPVELARLRIAFAPDPLGVSRMDIYLDGRRVGQLRNGMAFVVPIKPGLRVLSARVWLRRLDFGDRTNALPGTDSDVTIRVSGSKSRSYAVERHGLGATLADQRTILVEPSVSQA